VTTTVRRALSRGRADESGMVTAFVVVFTLALLAIAGLVLDGGLTLAAKVRAIDDAQAAARAGAQAIDIPLYRATGQIALDPTQAVADAEHYLAASGSTGAVTVTVRLTQPTQILSIVGVDTLAVSGTGTATAEQAP